nr:MAG TPA: hypothetical protein [Caudoviricetes sp.]
MGAKAHIDYITKPPIIQGLSRYLLILIDIYFCSVGVHRMGDLL